MTSEDGHAPSVRILGPGLPGVGFTLPLRGPIVKVPEGIEEERRESSTGESAAIPVRKNAPTLSERPGRKEDPGLKTLP